MNDVVLLEHGSGANKTRELISEYFVGKFNKEESADEDAALIFDKKLAFSTDSFIIEPEFFEGGNIGKLSVCGTANDLAVRGAKPMWFSASYVISEGYPLDKLRQITDSMAGTAIDSNIKIVTGDTKVIPRSSFSGIIINTSGVGIIINETSINHIQDEDVIIISGSLGDHATTIISQREGIYLDSEICSDCAVLYPMLEDIIYNKESHFIRDLTRGGLTSVLYEISIATGFGIEINENSIPVKPAVRELSDIMGIDYLGMANEGKVLLCVNQQYAEAVISKLKAHKYGTDAAIIGIITKKHNRIILNTHDNQMKLLQETTNIPRIC